MIQSEAPGRCPKTVSRKRRRKNFVQKSISGVFSFFEESLQNEAFVEKKGFLQGLDPRVKLISLIFVIFAVAMTRSIGILLAMYILSMFIAYSSAINMLFFMKRIWFFVPIFSGIIILPAIFNVFVPGDPAIVLMNIGPNAYIGPFALPEVIAITWQGLETAVRFILRVATCVSFAILLFLTTRRDILFKSLRSLYVPKIYVLILDMCYRYIFLFAGMIRDFYMAKKSRSLKPLPLIKEQKWVSERIGYTLIKSIKTGEKVHMAMLSRGFNGDVKIMHSYELHRKDYVAAAAFVTLGAALITISMVTTYIH